MYEFIASGIQPAKPLESYLKGAEAAQNMQINKVNIEAGKQRNEASDIALKSARKQVDAEDQWSKLPRGEDGSLDPQAEQQFKTAFPEYYDIRKKADVQAQRDQLGLTADKLTMSATLFGNAKSPDDIQKAIAFAKENFGMDIQHDPAVFGKVQQYSSDLARKTAMVQEDMATAAANGDYGTVKLLQDALNAESRMAQLEVLKAQTEIEKNRATTGAQNANAYKYFQQGNLANAKADKEGATDASGPRDKVNLRNAEKAVTDLDQLLSQEGPVRSAIAGEALGVGNKTQRGLAKLANIPLTLFGNEGITGMAQEFGDAQTVRQFRKAIEIAFNNNPKFPVAEMNRINALFDEIDPDSFTSSKGTAQVPLLEILTVLKNQREKYAAFLENREPNYIERPRLGNDSDPIVAPMGRDDAGIQEYLQKNGAKPGMVIQWPDGSRSTLKGKK